MRRSAFFVQVSPSIDAPLPYEPLLRGARTQNVCTSPYDEGYMTSDTRPRVFVARIIPGDGLQQIVAQTNADVWQDEGPPDRDELLRRVAGADGIVSMVTDRVDDELLDRAGPQL